MLKIITAIKTKNIFSDDNPFSYFENIDSDIMPEPKSNSDIITAFLAIFIAFR